MRVLRIFVGCLFGALILHSVSAAEEDPLVGEFRIEADAIGKTHKFWKKDEHYFYASCKSSECGPPEPARLLDDETLADWFQPGNRWKAIGVKGITVDGGGGVTIFYVDRPDDRVLQRTPTKYLFSFWVLTGYATKVSN